MSKQYEEDQRTWIKQVGLEIGDTVKVIAECDSYTGGWGGRWGLEFPDMKVGNVGRVTEVAGSEGIRVDAYYSYPFFVLIKLEEDE